jgi:hypothetical protein
MHQTSLVIPNKVSKNIFFNPGYSRLINKHILKQTDDDVYHRELLTSWALAINRNFK